jgi:serine/threonine-protein kinase HipA
VRPSLDVWRGEQRIGELWLGEDGRSMGFAYDAAEMPISNSLPLDGSPFPEDIGIAHNWFANLLPEEGARQVLVRRLGVADEDFSLLAAIGGDCAGALRLLPAGAQDEAAADLVPVEEQQLARWAEGIERYALFRPGREQETRLSLAGAQDKVPVLIRDGAMFLPQGSNASSHLIKFAANPGLILNELYMNRLAKLSGLPVPDSFIGRAGKGSYLAVARYDRIDNGGRMLRVHQEDMCQALGVPRRLKYQEEGGPSLGRCAELVRAVTAKPALQVRQLLRWQVFNVLAGNSDGHAKNLSLLQDANGRWSLAPAYDLVCTRVLNYSPQLGFAVGENFHPQELRLKDWEQFAREMTLAPPFVLRELREMVDAMEPAAQGDEVRQALIDAGMEEGDWSKLQHVRKYVVQQCRRYRKLA